MPVRYCALLLSLLVSTPALAQTTYKLYYLGGQSNMVGHGHVGQLVEEMRAKSDRVMIFHGQTALDDDPAGGIGRWAPLRPGHGAGFQTDGASNSYSNRFGPELTFGQAMAESPGGQHIAIVKYALGGSGLAPGVGFGSWYPDYEENTGRNQYDHALTTIQNAFGHADINGDGTPDRLVPAGIIWMQGESDAFESQAVADAYGANLRRLMGLLRAALRVDDLPVVLGRITDSGMAEDGMVMDYIGTVQAAQAAFAESDPCATLVTGTDDFDYLRDGWHYDSDGFIRLGKAFAEAAIELANTCPQD